MGREYTTGDCSTCILGGANILVTLVVGTIS